MLQEFSQPKKIEKIENFSKEKKCYEIVKSNPNGLSEKLEQLNKEILSWVRDETQEAKNHQIFLIFIQVLASNYFRLQCHSEQKHSLLRSQVQKICPQLFNHLIQQINFDETEAPEKQEKKMDTIFSTLLEAFMNPDNHIYSRNCNDNIRQKMSHKTEGFFRFSHFVKSTILQVKNAKEKVALFFGKNQFKKDPEQQANYKTFFILKEVISCILNYIAIKEIKDKNEYFSFFENFEKTLSPFECEFEESRRCIRPNSQSQEQKGYGSNSKIKAKGISKREDSFLDFIEIKNFKKGKSVEPKKRFRNGSPADMLFTKETNKHGTESVGRSSSYDSHKSREATDSRAFWGKAIQKIRNSVSNFSQPHVTFEQDDEFVMRFRERTIDQLFRLDHL